MENKLKMDLNYLVTLIVVVLGVFRFIIYGEIMVVVAIYYGSSLTKLCIMCFKLYIY